MNNNLARQGEYRSELIKGKIIMMSPLDQPTNIPAHRIAHKHFFCILCHFLLCWVKALQQSSLCRAAL